MTVRKQVLKFMHRSQTSSQSCISIYERQICGLFPSFSLPSLKDKSSLKMKIPGLLTKELDSANTGPELDWLIYTHLSQKLSKRETSPRGQDGQEATSIEESVYSTHSSPGHWESQIPRMFLMHWRRAGVLVNWPLCNAVKIVHIILNNFS